MIHRQAPRHEFSPVNRAYYHFTVWKIKRRVLGHGTLRYIFMRVPREYIKQKNLICGNLRNFVIHVSRDFWEENNCDFSQAHLRKAYFDLHLYRLQKPLFCVCWGIILQVVFSFWWLFKSLCFWRSTVLIWYVHMYLLHLEFAVLAESGDSYVSSVTESYQLVSFLSLCFPFFFNSDISTFMCLSYFTSLCPSEIVCEFLLSILQFSIYLFNSI